MNEDTGIILDQLFSKSLDQKTVRALRKDVERLEPIARLQLVSKVVQRLKQLLQDDLFTALSLVSLLSDGCQTLHLCLKECLSEILESCNLGLQTGVMKSGTNRYHVACKAIYAALQNLSTDDQTSLRNPVINSQLKELFGTIISGIVDENLPSDCALIVATSFCVIFTLIVEDDVVNRFWHLLKFIEKCERNHDKLTVQDFIKQLSERECDEGGINYSDIRISYPVVLTVHGLLNSGVSWIYLAGCSNVETASSAFVSRKYVESEVLIKENQSPDICDLVSYKELSDLTLQSSRDISNGDSLQQRLMCRERWTFLYLLYPLVRKCCRSSSSYSFQTFQVLHCWLQSIRKMVRRLQKDPEHCTNCAHAFTAPSNLQIFAIPCEFRDSVFHLLNANWESPSKGVSDIVYTCMMELVQLHEDESPGQAKNIAMQMISILVDANAWNLKSTYPPLALALSYAGAQVVLEKYPALPKSLLESLTINYLAPSGTNVYKIILGQVISSVWKKFFLSVITEALHSLDRMVRQNVLMLWLPITLRQYPDVYLDLLNNCHQSSSEGWLARMAILKVARSCGNIDLNEKVKSDMIHDVELMPITEYVCESSGKSNAEELDLVPLLSILRYAISHVNETVRSEALAFLCHTRKASHPVSQEEVAFIKEFFTLNMNIDSAPFRQDVIKCYKALVVRLRDTCTSVLRNPPYKTMFTKEQSPKFTATDVSTKSDLYINGELLIWFLFRFHYNLKPGGNYQRRILSLQLYRETLLAFYEVRNQSEYIFNKRFLPVCVFMNFFNKNYFGCIHETNNTILQEVIDLTLPWTREVLLCCCLDDMNDIREQAEGILGILESSRVKQSQSEIEKWLEQGLMLCNSPKASEVEGGASVIKTLYCSSDVDTLLKNNEITDGPVNFLQSLYNRVEVQFEAAQRNLLVASRETPIHGSLLALGRCLCEGHSRTAVPFEETQEFLQKLLKLMVEMVEFFLSVLAMSSKNGSAVAPSFAEMGDSIEMIIKKCSDGMEAVQESFNDKSEQESYAVLNCSSKFHIDIDESEEDETAISSDHALVLACCWQTMKICCLVSTMCASKWLTVLSEEQVETILRSIVLRVLTGTRHKGAMEAARLCYSQLSALLLGSNSTYKHLICQQIDDILNQIKSGVQTSVTRRAAGVAMMVQVACGAVPRMNRALVDSTITRLMDITQSDYEEQSTVDSPAVLALHILRSLVIHASLAHHLVQYMPAITVLCLKAFASDSWAIRNASLQLYGAVVPRMVGQKKVRDDSSALNSLTASEFLSRHAELADYLLNLLQSFKNTKELHLRITGKDENVAGVIGTETKDTNVERENGEACTLMPTDQHYMSLKAYSHLVPVLSLLARLSPGTGLQQSQELSDRLYRYYNETLHLLGSPIHTVRRLTALSLVALTPSEQAVEVISSLVASLISKKCTANELHGNLLTIKSFLDVYPEALQDEVLKEHLILALEKILKSTKKCFVSLTLAVEILNLCEVRDWKFDFSSVSLSVPGSAQFMQTYIKLQLKQFSDDEIEHFLTENVFSQHEVEDNFLSYIENHLNGFINATWMVGTEKHIWQKLECNENLQSASLRILCLIARKQNRITHTPSVKCMKKLLLLLKGYQGTKITLKALIVIAYAIKDRNSENWIELEGKNEIIGEYCSVISAYANPSATEDYRLTASLSLQISVAALISGPLDIGVSLKEQVIVAILELLQDEDPEVRESACKIVHQLQTGISLDKRSFYCRGQMCKTVHPNLALKYFIEIMVRLSIYHKDGTALRILWRSAYLDSVSEYKPKVSLFQSEAYNLYKEPEYYGYCIVNIIEAAVKEYVEERKRNEAFKPECFITEWLHEESKIMNKHGSFVRTVASQHQNLLNDKKLLTAVSTYITAYEGLSSICNILEIQSELYCPVSWKQGKFLVLILYEGR